jgi:DNA-binding transcriptional ArsR family regulator
MSQPKSGYKTLTMIQLGNVLSAAFNDGLSLNGFRTFFACVSALAIREAATRTNARNRRDQVFVPSYRIEELAKATNLSKTIVKRELKSLKNLGLIDCSPKSIEISKVAIADSQIVLDLLSAGRSSKRPVPVPRSILRFLARCEQKSIQRTLLTYICRGLSISRIGEITGKGSVKASWISQLTGLSLRAVRSARKSLIESQIISKDVGSIQRKLNRDGAYFQIDLDWSDVKSTPSLDVRPTLQALPVVREIAHQQVQNGVIFALPYKNKKTPYGSKYQKAHGTSLLKPSGAFKQKGRGGNTPTISNITLADLHDYHRIRSLYQQACKAGWVKESENSFLNWLAAAIRAKTQTEGDSVRIFVGIVRKKLYAHITQAEEDRARVAMNRFRYSESPN